MDSASEGKVKDVHLQALQEAMLERDSLHAGKRLGFLRCCQHFFLISGGWLAAGFG